MRKKIECVVLAAVMMLVCSMPNVYAVEEVQVAEESVMTRDEAIEFLGLTEEEAEGGTFYEVIPSENGIEMLREIPERVIAPSPNITKEDVTFTHSFTGAPHELKGSLFKWGVKVHSGNKQLLIGIYNYDSNWAPAGIKYNNITDGAEYTSDWDSIPKGTSTFYFKYYVNGNNYEEMIPFHITMILYVR